MTCLPPIYSANVKKKIIIVLRNESFVFKIMVPYWTSASIGSHVTRTLVVALRGGCQASDHCSTLCSNIVSVTPVDISEENSGQFEAAFVKSKGRCFKWKHRLGSRGDPQNKWTSQSPFKYNMLHFSFLHTHILTWELPSNHSPLLLDTEHQLEG